MGPSDHHVGLVSLSDVGPTSRFTRIESQTKLRGKNGLVLLMIIIINKIVIIIIIRIKYVDYRCR